MKKASIMSTNNSTNNNINTNTNTYTNTSTNTNTTTNTSTNTSTDTETNANTETDANTVLSFSFDFTSCTPPKDVLALVGDAYYQQDNRCLSLIAADKSGAPVHSSYGRAIYVKSAVPFSGPDAGPRAGFLTTIKFILTRAQDGTLPGDGLVFFMAPVDYTFPKRTTDGNFGIFDQDSGDDPLPAPPVFAIEFDTYTNSWDPVGGQHLGIDIQYRVSKASEAISSPDSFIGDEVTMKICYEGTSGRIFAVATADKFTSEVSYVSDLSSVLPSEVAVGLAASTGGSCAAFHKVNFWEFTSTTPA